jgi:CheY-like chemotaxis protein
MTKRIGNLLLEAKVLSREQLEEALKRQERFGGRLATCCLANGYADERILCMILSNQHGVPFVVFSKSAIRLDLLTKFPLEVARKLKALPVHSDGREMIVAMADPKNLAVLDELAFTTGRKIIEHGALDGILHDAIEESYRLLSEGNATFYMGADFDPSMEMDDSGHVEIAVGRGEISAESKPPPVSKMEQEMAAGADWVDELSGVKPPPAPEEKRGETILLVEDESELRRMLKMFLEKSGFDVVEAADGTQAVRALKDRLPDVIILDAMLPGIHGFDICYRVKHSESTMHIPVVMISAVYRGWRYADDVRSLYGADVFMEKPLRLDELKHVLDKCLKERSPATSPDLLSGKSRDALEKAAGAYRSGDLFDAAGHLEEAVAASPFSAELHQRLGLLFDRLDDPYRAIASLERAVELDPDFDKLITLARLYEKTGFSHKAFEAWERCLRCCTDDKEAGTIRSHMEKLLK